jgi:class 3 adenylate cyclase/tetratricopeptide (TPR) repeat protein
VRTCGVCGASNPETARFCGNCGTALTPRCARCGAELPLPVRFCPECGNPVAEAPVLSQERKLVTMLFADVTGSTGLGERLDPESLKEVMDAYFEAMRRPIEREGGTVEKFIGDAVMAVFGVPVSHEDDATRALRAALAMRNELESLNRMLAEVHGLTLEMRVGVGMGEVMAATPPRPGEGMVIGDAANVAARLEQSADPGQIRVSERAARAARGFRLVEIGPLQLRGKEARVHAYELLGESAAGEGGPLSLGAPMVGREREMALLETVYERVAGEGRPHLITVYGDPGVGKSRLIAEFEAWAERLDASPAIVRGRCLPHGEAVTYWPMAEILKTQAGVLDSDPPSLALQKVEVLGKELLSPELAPDPGRAAAALAFSVGIQHPNVPFSEEEPRRVRAEISSAWRSYFSALARRRPTVAVIEDIHWADAALLDLLEELTDHAEGPLLFLCPARPELTGRRAGWGGGRRNVSSLLLEPLTAEESERLVEFLLEGTDLPRPARARIRERGGGNPFFLEEIIHHVLEGAGVDGGEIPDTVQGVLAARMDLLGQLEKRTLQSASVVGRVFWIGPLARLVSKDRAGLEEALAHLEDRGLVLARLGSSMAGEREYLFKHVLTRDVAYDSLPRRQRASAHAEVADWIEETAGERWPEFVELLAHHYSEAYRSAREQARPDPALGEELRAKAFHYALRAAEEARSKLVLETARRMAEGAVSLAGTADDKSRALEALGETYYLSSQGDLAWAALREAIDARLAGGPEDGPALARLCARALEVATRGRGAMRARLSEDDAAPYLDIGLSRGGAGDGEERARLLTVQSFWPYSFRGKTSTDDELVRARRSGEEAAAMAMRLGRPDLESAALDGVGSYDLSRGLYGLMDQVVDRRLGLVDSLHDAAEVGDIFGVAAWVAFHVGNYPRALELADEGFTRALPEAPLTALDCLDWRALARCRLGQWDEFENDVALIDELLGDRRENPPGFASDHIGAAAFVSEVRGQTDSADHRLRILTWLEQAEERPSPGWLVWHALLLARRGEFAEARAHLERPEEGLQYGRGYILSARCDVLAEEGAWEEAPPVVAEARRHAAEAGLLALPFHADRLEGSAALAAEDIEAATMLLRSAANGFTSLKMRWEAARTTLVLGEAIARGGKGERAKALISKALPTLEELGSLREIGRAREALETLG